MFKNWERFLPLFLRRQFEGRKNLKKITENIGWLFFDKVLRMGMGLVVGVWVARYFGPERFGIWNYAMAFSVIFSAIASLGLDSVVVHEIVKNSEKENEILGSAFILRLIGGFFSFIISSFIIYIIRPNDTLTFWLVFIFSAGYICNAFMVLDFYNQAKIKSKYTVISLNSSFILTSLLKVFLIFLKAPVIFFAFASLLEIVLGMFLMIFFYQKKNSRSIFLWTPLIVNIKKLLKKSWPLMIAFFSYFIYTKTDQIMLREMVHEKAVGFYSAAYKIYEVPISLLMIVATSLMPHMMDIYNNNKSQYYKNYYNLTYISTMSVYLLVVMIFLFKKIIINFTFGEEYLPSSDILVVLMIGQVFMFNAFLRSGYLVVSGNQKIIMITTAISALFNIFLNYILIQRYGTLGAALSTSFAQFLSLVLLNFFFPATRKIFYLQIKSLLIIPYLFKKRIDK